VTADEHWSLWHRDPRATAFQSPAWLGAWWTHLGTGERVDVEAWIDGTLVASLPMFVWWHDGRRRLAPAGAGHADYSDALIDPAVPGALSALWNALAALEWDELWLPDLRGDSPLLGGLPNGWTADDEPTETCPVLTLPPGDLLAGLSKTQRRKVVHDRHRAERLGGVSVAFAEPGEIDDALEALFALHAARWAMAGEPGMLADARVQAFHRAAAPALAAAGLLRMPVVRHEGRIVSVLLALGDARRGLSYVIGSDFLPGQSFGTLAFAAAIERAHADGAREYHFLRGEEPYKFQWGAVPTRTTRRLIRR
jgi:CelD/BcsL family acetyltransferase involved in cellulose biosynthesis